MNSLGLFSSTHRKRYRQVVSVLAKYGFDELLAFPRLKKAPIISRLTPKDPELASLSRWERMRLAIEELGGAFVKVGQILSNRPDLLPQELLVELEKLQDSVPPFPTEQALEVIESELKNEMSELFLMFDEEPLASASLSQVHRAVLLDGTPVVLKILRPDIEDQFIVDLDVISYMSQHLGKIPALESQFENQNPIKELRMEIEKELDFSIEATSINRFRDNFRNDPRIYIPETFPGYCTKKVLTMSFIDGVKVTDIISLKEKGYNIDQIADNLIDLGLEQIFDYRFFHGDPHPGNIFILENNRVAFLDFGLVGRLTAKQRQNIIDLIIAFSQKDANKISRIILKNIPQRTYIDIGKLENEVDKLLDQYFDKSLQDINIGELLNDALSLIYTYNLTLSSNLYLLIKAVISYEGIGRKLVPDFEMSARVKPYAKKFLWEKLSPQTIIKDLYTSSSEALALLRDFPREARSLLYLLQSGRFRINIDIADAQKYLDQVILRIDKITNRIAYAIVLAAMILGSAIALQASVGEQIGGVPMFAAIGFVVSGVMAFILLVSILRRGAL